MRDIKVGDRVRATRADEPYFSKGAVGVVLKLDYTWPAFAQVAFDGGTSTVCGDGIWWEQVGYLEFTAEPFTVILLRPDYASHNYGQDTYMITLQALDPVEALKLARDAVIAADCGTEPFDGEPTDYFCIALIRGEHEDLNPEA